MTRATLPARRILGLVLCTTGLVAILLHGRAVARRAAEARDAAQVEDLLFRELEVEARQQGASLAEPDAASILRARAHHEAELFARALADGMEYLDPVVEARLLQLLGADLGQSRPSSDALLSRAKELNLLANDPVLRRRLVNKRSLLEEEPPA